MEEESSDSTSIGASGVELDFGACAVLGDGEVEVGGSGGGGGEGDGEN